MVLQQLKKPLELFVKSKEFLPGRAYFYIITISPKLLKAI